MPRVESAPVHPGLRRRVSRRTGCRRSSWRSCSGRREPSRASTHARTRSRRARTGLPRASAPGTPASCTLRAACRAGSAAATATATIRRCRRRWWSGQSRRLVAWGRACKTATRRGESRVRRRRWRRGPTRRHRCGPVLPIWASICGDVSPPPPLCLLHPAPPPRHCMGAGHRGWGWRIYGCRHPHRDPHYQPQNGPASSSYIRHRSAMVSSTFEL